MSQLPEIIRSIAHAPPTEDILKHVMAERLPGVPVLTQVQLHQTFPSVVVRRIAQFGAWDGDPRFIDEADVAVYTFCDGIDADQDASTLAEACRVVLHQAARDQAFAPGLGHISAVAMTSGPRQVTDWASATGPVQYADLPSGVERYETLFRVRIRMRIKRPGT